MLTLRITPVASVPGLNRLISASAQAGDYLCTAICDTDVLKTCISIMGVELP